MGIEEHNFKKLLREAAEEKASLRFTDHVLKGIEAELQKQTALETSLKRVLQKHAIEQPSADFRSKIMASLSPAPAEKFKPIISRTIWYGIAAAVVVLLLTSFLFPSALATDAPRVLTFIGKAANLIPKAPNLSNGSLEVAVLTLVGLSTLLLLENFLRPKLLINNKL